MDCELNSIFNGKKKFWSQKHPKSFRITHSKIQTREKTCATVIVQNNAVVNCTRKKSSTKLHVTQGLSFLFAMGIFKHLIISDHLFLTTVNKMYIYLI